MKLSIIIVNYNTEKITLNCLKSIEKYPFPGDFEVILIDNGSVDDSVNKITKFSKKIKNFRFSLLKNKDNLGFSKANNQGMRKARGKYILLLNSDTLLTKNALHELVEFADNHAGAGVIAPKLLNEDLTTQPSVFRLPTLSRTVRQYWLGEIGLTDKYAPDVSEPTEVEAVVGAAFLITDKAIENVGLLNEKYFMFYEDLDYCRKVLNAGLKVYYLPNTKIVHLHGKSGEKLANNKDQWKRLVPASKIYHGKVVHYLRWFVMRASQVFNNGKN